MAKDTNHKDVRDLAAKGDGVLVRRGNVWTYPGCPTDPSGTNLKLPTEFVTDEQVQAAMGESVFVTTTVDPIGTARAIRLSGDDDAPVMSTAQAGTAHAGTELPVGSRPELDAGATDISPNEAARLAEASMRSALTPQPAPVVVAPASKPVTPAK